MTFLFDGETYMKKYGIYLETNELCLVTFVDADNYSEAREKADKLGYRGEHYRVEEFD